MQFISLIPQSAVLDLTHKNLAAILEKMTKYLSWVCFEDFLKFVFYKPVFKNVCADDLQRFSSNLINTPIFHFKSLNPLYVGTQLQISQNFDQGR